MEQQDLLKYFMERTKNDFDTLNKRMDAFDTKLDDVWAFKLKTLGVIAGFSTLFSVVATLITLYLKAF